MKKSVSGRRHRLPARPCVHRSIVVKPPKRGIYRFSNMATMTLADGRRIFRNGA